MKRIYKTMANLFYCYSRVFNTLLAWLSSLFTNLEKQSFIALQVILDRLISALPDITFMWPIIPRTCSLHLFLDLKLANWTQVVRPAVASVVLYDPNLKFLVNSKVKSYFNYQTISHPSVISIVEVKKYVTF